MIMSGERTLLPDPQRSPHSTSQGDALDLFHEKAGLWLVLSAHRQPLPESTVATCWDHLIGWREKGCSEFNRVRVRVGALCSPNPLQ